MRQNQTLLKHPKIQIKKRNMNIQSLAAFVLAFGLGLVLVFGLVFWLLGAVSIKSLDDNGMGYIIALTENRVNNCAPGTSQSQCIAACENSGIHMGMALICTIIGILVVVCLLGAFWSIWSNRNQPKAYEELNKSYKCYCLRRCFIC